MKTTEFHGGRSIVAGLKGSRELFTQNERRCPRFGISEFQRFRGSAYQPFGVAGGLRWVLFFVLSIAGQAQFNPGMMNGAIPHMSSATSAPTSLTASEWPRTWTNELSCPPSGPVQYAGGLFFTTRYMSFDGMTWRAMPAPPNQNGLNHICYGNVIWIMTGSGGQVFTSPDLQKWTQRKTPDTNASPV